MHPHRINLRGPWLCAPWVGDRNPQEQSSASTFCRVVMPSRWIHTPLSGASGRIRCLRNFHWPKPLAVNERLFLVVGAADDEAEVRLNGQMLGRHVGPFDPFEFEITERIASQNELCIDLAAQGGLWGTVYLEVRRECYLQQPDLEVRWNDEVPRLRISGNVCGPEHTALDLDVLLNDALLSSQPVAASLVGEPFHMEVELPDIERWQAAGRGKPRLHPLQLELLDVHTRLFLHAEAVGVREIRPEAGSDQVRVNGHVAPVIAWVLQEPVLESATLDRADAQGKLLRVLLPQRCGPERETVTRYLKRHPCVVEVRAT